MKCCNLTSMGRGNHCIQVHLSFIQHQNHEMVCNLDYIFFLVDLTLESTKNEPQIRLVQVHLRWEDHKLARDQVFMVGAWKVHSYAIIPTLQLVWTLLASILCWGWVYKCVHSNFICVQNSQPSQDWEVYSIPKQAPTSHLFCINKVPQNGQIIWLWPNLFFPSSEYLCRYEPCHLHFTSRSHQISDTTSNSLPTVPEMMFSSNPKYLWSSTWNCCTSTANYLMCLLAWRINTRTTTRNSGI